jgi:hypothetical protein
MGMGWGGVGGGDLVIESRGIPVGHDLVIGSRGILHEGLPSVAVRHDAVIEVEARIRSGLQHEILPSSGSVSIT